MTVRSSSRWMVGTNGMPADPSASGSSIGWRSTRRQGAEHGSHGALRGPPLPGVPGCRHDVRRGPGVDGSDARRSNQDPADLMRRWGSSNETARSRPLPPGPRRSSTSSGTPRAWASRCGRRQPISMHPRRCRPRASAAGVRSQRAPVDHVRRAPNGDHHRTPDPGRWPAVPARWWYPHRSGPDPSRHVEGRPTGTPIGMSLHRLVQGDPGREAERRGSLQRRGVGLECRVSEVPLVLGLEIVARCTRCARPSPSSRSISRFGRAPACRSIGRRRAACGAMSSGRTPCAGGRQRHRSGTAGPLRPRPNGAR